MQREDLIGDSNSTDPERGVHERAAVGTARRPVFVHALARQWTTGRRDEGWEEPRGGEGVASGESRDEMEMAKVAGNVCGMATHAIYYGSFHKPWPAIGPMLSRSVPQH